MLAQIGVSPVRVDPPNIDEQPRPRELPAGYAQRMARSKAAAAAILNLECAILAADTVVACGRRILPKAEDEETARRCLALLSGRRHRVFGAVTLMIGSGPPAQRLVRTDVAMRRLTDQDIAAYLVSGEWHGKAGGYAIQGRAATFVRWLGGSYSNVVGLPLFETAQLLRGVGLMQP